MTRLRTHPRAPTGALGFFPTFLGVISELPRPLPDMGRLVIRSKTPNKYATKVSRQGCPIVRERLNLLCFALLCSTSLCFVVFYLIFSPHHSRRFLTSPVISFPQAGQVTSLALFFVDATSSLPSTSPRPSDYPFVPREVFG